MRERKHYELRSTRKPGGDTRLASMVIVLDEEGDKGYAYVLFSDSFVTAVGKALPRGISQHDPAGLLVAYNKRTTRWEIKARYLGSVEEYPITYPLWSSAEKPVWLSIVKFHNTPEHHGNSTHSGRAV